MSSGDRQVLDRLMDEVVMPRAVGKTPAKERQRWMGLLMGINKVVDIGEPLTGVSDIEEWLAGCWNPSLASAFSKKDGVHLSTKPVSVEQALDETVNIWNHLSGE